MIDKLTIERVKEAAGIVDVIGDFYELKKQGVEYACRCPFHEDRHIGSFKISPKKNYAKCFSCGWQGGPIDFIMQHERLSFADAIRWLGKKYGIEVEGSDKMDVRPSVPRQQVPPLPMLTLPMDMALSRRNLDGDTLAGWIRTGINWGTAQRSRIQKVFSEYMLGHSVQGMSIYWQIDEQHRVRTGKMMRYKPDGHRDKESPYSFDWIHSALYRDQRLGYSSDKTDVKTCLFGLHLLNTYPRADVHIVESEKTAILMAIAYGNHERQVWMACGGIGNLNREKLGPIIAQHRNIVLYPDRDGVGKWREKSMQMMYSQVTVNDKPVTEWWTEEDGQKADIADILIRIINQSDRPATIADAMDKNPNIKKLIDNLQLEPVK